MGRYTARVQDHLVLPARALLVRGQEQMLRLQGRAVPPAVTVRLLIDTGAKRSSLIPGIITHLDPPLASRVRVETSLSNMQTALFWVRIEFPGTGLDPIPYITVARLPMPASLHTFQGVVGRDLLNRWECLLYEGRRERLTMRDRSTWPFGWLRRFL